MRLDAKVQDLPLPKVRRLLQIHQWLGDPNRAGHQGGGVQHGAVRITQSHSQPDQDPLP